MGLAFVVTPRLLGPAMSVKSRPRGIRGREGDYVGLLGAHATARVGSWALMVLY
jgi:hypothetical protein